MRRVAVLIAAGSGMGADAAKVLANEDFNIAVKILLYLINNFRNLKISEYPLVLNYHHKIGDSKMKIYKNIFLTLRLIFLRKF